MREMVVGQGWSRPKDLPAWDDPWVAFRIVKDDKTGQAERRPIRPEDGKDLWRDFASLFLLDPSLGGSSATSARASIVQQIDGLLRDDYLPESTPIAFEAFGVRTDGKMKLFEGQTGIFDFPSATTSRKL